MVLQCTSQSLTKHGGVVHQTCIAIWTGCRNPLSVLTAQALSRAPVVENARRIINFVGSAVMNNEYYLLAEYRSTTC